MRKCSICDSPIKNGRCQVCGMPYRRDEEMYHLNENRRDHYAHASKKVQERLRQLETPKSRSGSAKKTAAKKRSEIDLEKWFSGQGFTEMEQGLRKKVAEKSRKPHSVVWPILIILCVGIVGMVPAISNWITERQIERARSQTEELVMAEPVDEENADWKTREVYRVEPFEQVLTAGEYIVGRNLPAGTYDMVLEEDGELQFDINDSVNGIYEFLVFTHDTGLTEEFYCSEISDYELVPGSVLRLTGNGQLHAVNEEGYWSEQYEEQDNPLTESYILEMEEIVSGEDFEPGFYDFSVEEGMASLSIHISEPEEDYIYVTLGKESFYASPAYRQVYLSEGVSVRLEDEREGSGPLVMSPSPRIYGEK